ncbi:MAG TPA: hypothetical protein VHB70_12820 [Parafilimonas sp.]|nr:hypothetical protein [Parafilimonas sp.]
MTRPRNIIQKIIAIFFIIWGVGILSCEVYNWYITFQIIHVSWDNFSLLTFLKNQHVYFLAPLLTFISGVLLLLRNRLGWIIGVCISLFIPFGFFIYPAFNIQINKTDTASIYIILITCILFLIIFILLISKPIRLNYFPNKMTWSSIAIIFVLLMADEIFIQQNRNRRYNEIKKQFESDSSHKRGQNLDSTIK